MTSIRWTAAMLVLLMAACVTMAGDDGAVDPLAGLPEFLDELRQDYQVPGVAVVVVGLTPEPAIFTSGQRALDDDAPITADTLFEIASVTKTFNATLAAVLVDEGRLEWDTRVKELIPELELADPVAAERATLRDLLCHRVGYGRNSIPSFNVDQGPEWWLPRLKLLRPESEFRDRARYGGVMVSVSGLMLARAGKAPWPELVRDRLLEPLAMRRTDVAARVDRGGDVAVGHIEVDGSPVRATPVSLSVEVAESGLYSTAHDLGRWLQFLIHEGAIDGRQLVASSTMHETWTPNAVFRREGRGADAEIRAYGLGWQIWSRFGGRWLSHAGGGIGYTAQLAFLPDRGVGVAVLSNRAIDPIPSVVCDRVLYGALGEVYPYQREQAVAMVERMIAMRREQREAMLLEREPGAEPLLPLSSYSGRYTDVLYGDVEVAVEGKRLGFTFHGLPVEATFLHDHVVLLWSPLFDGWRARFEVAPDGGVTTLHMTVDGEDVGFERSKDKSFEGFRAPTAGANRPLP